MSPVFKNRTCLLRLLIGASYIWMAAIGVALHDPDCLDIHRTGQVSTHPVSDTLDGADCCAACQWIASSLSQGAVAAAVVPPIKPSIIEPALPASSVESRPLLSLPPRGPPASLTLLA